MELDIDYLEVQRRARRARWRMRLAALAMLACSIMLGDLVAQAQPENNEATPEFSCPDGTAPLPDSRFTLAGVNRASVFNFTGGTLCSPAD